jgi:hypothetical protein
MTAMVFSPSARSARFLPHLVFPAALVSFDHSRQANPTFAIVGGDANNGKKKFRIHTFVFKTRS